MTQLKTFQNMDAVVQAFAPLANIGQTASDRRREQQGKHNALVKLMREGGSIQFRNATEHGHLHVELPHGRYEPDDIDAALQDALKDIGADALKERDGEINREDVTVYSKGVVMEPAIGTDGRPWFIISGPVQVWCD